jgi:hypothetical protein
MNEHLFRQSLIEMLVGGEAHVAPRKALQGVNPALRTARPSPELHSVWEELEHMRLAQQDIYRYTIDPAWKSPEFPDGYWPAAVTEITEEVWKTSVTGFLNDLEEVVELIQNPGVDLTANIPHAPKHTYLREILLVADHNAYHLGQIVQTRKALGDWPK